jgi:hypothetical protein
MLRQHRILPDAPSGYALLNNRGRSLWSVLEAVGSTNLITNPSFETNQNGYSGIAGTETFLRTTARQRRGVWGMQVTPTAATTSGIRYGLTLTAGQTYTWSVDALLPGGIGYVLEVVNNSNVQVAIGDTVMGRGVWRRYNLTFTPAATQNHYLRLRKNGSTSLLAFVTDGWQLEALPYATTYFDGDSRGYDVDYTDANGAPRPQPYQWLGTPHGSTSQRLATTRSGGRRRYLDEFGWSQPSMTGTLQVPMLVSDARFANGGGMFQRAIRDVRTLALVGMIIGNPLPQAAQLADLFNPENGPATLVYQKHEDDDEVYIPAVYQSGLEGDITNDYRLDTPLQFNVYDPITKGYDVSSALNYSVNVTNANSVLMRTASGVWQSLGTGMSGTLAARPLPEVTTIVQGPDSAYYIAGQWLTANGVTTNGIAKWDGSNFTALGTGTTNIIYDLVFDPSGNLYAVGEGTFGGVAGTQSIARWNGSAWQAVGTVAGGVIYTVAAGPDGAIYVGGSFTSINGVANTNKVAKYNGSTWSALATTTPNNLVTALAVDLSNNVYVGGAFTAIGATSYGYIAKNSVGTWSALGLGMSDAVNDLQLGPDGYLYAGGPFKYADNRTVNGIARWNGSAWQELGSGVEDATAPTGAGNIGKISIQSNGRIFVAGYFQKAGGSVVPEPFAQWTGSAWIPLDVDVPGSGLSMVATVGTDGTLLIGFGQSGTAKSAITTITSTGTDNAYPTATFTGPGQIFQLYNYTTGDIINFNNLVLNSGEVATLRISPQGTTFESNFRGSLLSYIGPGSNPSSWKLQQGANNVSSFMTSTTSATSIYLTFRVPIGKLT